MLFMGLPNIINVLPGNALDFTGLKAAVEILS
jgi:hypothetical protein